MIRSPKAPTTPRLALWLWLIALVLLPTARAAEHSLYVDLGVEQQKTSWLFLVEPGLSIQTRPFALRLAAPLRFDMEDRFHLWSRDWDALSDAGRVLRELSLRVHDGAFRLFLGNLTHTTFGHGTLVQGFIASLDPDAMPLGANARLQLGPVALEAMVSDVFGPEIFGGNLSLEPVSLFGPTYDRLHLTGTFVADPTAPGDAREDGTRGDSSWVILYGVGLDWAVVRTERWQIAPYFDANFNGRGYGFHAGLLADVVFRPLKLSLRAEWRWAQAPYAPDYFDLAYAIERRDFWAAGELPISQAEAVAAIDWAHSGKVELRAESGPLSATAVLAAMGQDLFNASVVVNAVAGDFELSVFGALRHFEFGHNPDRALGLAEARYRFLDYFYTWLSAGQLYRLDESGRASALFTWSTGVGVAFLLNPPPEPNR
ncbi:MAG: hypothetical protein IKC51_06340 [Myxococcaceae bacterium]|nr:hypothetical protein [Myxococcaceae bacterium]